MFNSLPQVMPPAALQNSPHGYTDLELKDYSDQSEGDGAIYANHLFEGTTIPSRQKSFSENSPDILNPAYNRSRQFLQPMPINQNFRSRGNTTRQISKGSPGFESHGVESTTLSSEILNKKLGSEPDSDHLKYLFDPNFGYERRSDSFESKVPPCLPQKYKLKDSQQPKLFGPTQRKITEDKEYEELSHHSSDSEDKKDEIINEASKGKSMMSKRSEGFIPKRYRKADDIPFDIDNIVGSAGNSRKHSEASADDQLQEHFILKFTLKDDEEGDGALPSST